MSVFKPLYRRMVVVVGRALSDGTISFKIKTSHAKCQSDLILGLATRGPKGENTKSAITPEL
jgi:hypothetical protein